MNPPDPNHNFSALIDPQAYARTRQMIQSYRTFVDQLEAQNEAGHQAYAHTEQELQRRIQEGRQAEMLAAQLRAGNFPHGSQRQTFIAQQPQAATWHMAPPPPPNTQQDFFPTSARIEEVPPVSSGRSSRSGSHSAPQRNANNSHRRSYQFSQSQVPRNTNGSYEQFPNDNAPVHTTTFISNDFYPGRPPMRQSHYAPPQTVHVPAAPIQQPPPAAVHQPAPQWQPPNPVPSASSPTSLNPVPVHNVPLPPSTVEQNQSTARYDFVSELIRFLESQPPDVQTRLLAQIVDCSGGKPTPNHLIRTWGDRLKQAGDPDPKELAAVVVNQLMERRRTQRVARPQSDQLQPATHAEPPPPPQPAVQPQFQTAHLERSPQPTAAGIAEKLADDSQRLTPAEQQALDNLFVAYAHELKKEGVDGTRAGRAGDIVKMAYVSARLKQLPNSPETSVQMTLEFFGKYFGVENIPLVLEYLLKRFQLPIPNVPVPTEPRNVGHPSNSLTGAFVDTMSNATSSSITGQSNPVAPPPGNDAQERTSDSVPEARSPQSQCPAPPAIPQTQVTGNVPYISPQPSPSMPVSPPNLTTASHDASTVQSDTSRGEYQAIDYSHLALVPSRKLPSIIPSQTQGQVRQQQVHGWVPYYQQYASASSLPKQPSVRARLPREADRSRLAKDILKQLGRPSGVVPAVPMIREYRERKKAETKVASASAQPSINPMLQPNPTSNRDDGPLHLEVVPVPDQVVPSVLPEDQSLDIQADEPPSLGYPDQDTESAPHDASAPEQDVEMGAQPSEEPLVSQPSGSPRPDPPQDPAPSPVTPGPAQDKEFVAGKPPPPKPESSKWSGPPADVEIIEISDDEEQPAVIANAEPMDVDEEVGKNATISKSLSQLSLDSDDTPVAVEIIEDHATESLGRQSSREFVVSEDMQFTGKESQKNQPSAPLPLPPDLACQSKGKEQAPIEEEEEEDPELQAVINLAFSRLRPTRCLWLGCRATLNSVDDLIKHLKIHADEAERTSNILECQWKKCTRSYKTRVKLDRHCMHHAQKVLHCPYEDCGEEFRDAGELLYHTKDMHEHSDLLPSTDPVPYLGEELDELPEEVPSWSIFPASVAPVPISVDRHSQIGRWIARNICGTAKRTDLSRRLRNRFDTGKQKSTVSEMEEIMNEERFGFLSSTDDGNVAFEDIPSEAVSLSCREGLVTLTDNDGHAARDSGGKESGIESTDVEDRLVVAGAPVEEDTISLELELRSSDDELLLRPESP